MQSINNKASAIIVLNLIRTIQKNKDYLSKIDGEIGDGDHGINMNKGVTLCQERIVGSDGLTDAFEKLGQVLLSEIGGSMGPLYGMFFLAMKTESEGKEEIDGTIFLSMLKAACTEITDLGNAKVGDKTLIDTLDPAIASYEREFSESKDFIKALESMDKAAEEGYLSTKNLVAKIGRSSRLGERSLGVLDAGAMSCYLLLHSMKESIISLLEGGIS